MRLWHASFVAPKARWKIPDQLLNSNMADNEEVHYERERSRSRDRGAPRDYHEDDVRGAGSVGSQQDDGAQYDDSRNNRNEDSARRHVEDPDVNNLYVTNLSFQVLL